MHLDLDQSLAWGFMTLKGGEYFFAPCISFLTSLP
jgi:hypothetical protein